MKIPSDAKRVFHGVIFDVYQWEQEMFDGSKVTFERLKRPSTALVIPVVGKKVVMAFEEQPMREERLTLLGGRQEEGEDVLSTVRRELLEEAGMESDDWEPFRTYEPVAKMDWQIHVYVARNCRTVAKQKLDAGERIRLVEFEADEFVDRITAPECNEREISNDLFRMKANGRLHEFHRILGIL
ncbi:hypothetical protein A2348_02750 [Candidatus Uhrbacteria bacterium RIFOXYB12_FULL_58_10]|uniref:Nudix hydrolase domain-containing protein n=1 Tax=Candidatus Uhrbacteria bacterium RIFOXYB2_FULL_57_15 TaxID=1802422 RepID=A0A1F7W6R4_9BACT|nr:MAG: hypothetical protein A2348_02750 [Candidatus Uhrbacteria bacterium RIFOXYB12_FULL_58_10]OGL98470.1 MAG: hypothetical protein A2304_02140 [Candidatus Uhrbacteria bacterium RIFOXYB2_FULL_57_15]OGL99215.1 MAG: hypothetical protein A2501_03395 [Candidatus Uhrbacteria bacterium RIFOXYC12_FULL_57_11]